MPTVDQLREKLKCKLKELFQLDEPDLDFGFYRIMHAKAKEVQDFIDNDLLCIVNEYFQEADQTQLDRLRAEYEKALETAFSFGAPEPEKTPAAVEARIKLDAAKDTAAAEAEVYDHLSRFFSRYYDDGDFVSLRYYSRETAGKAAPYAIPHNGEEVKLHWANADQYYIKTTEQFSNFTVVIGMDYDSPLPTDRQRQFALLSNTKTAPKPELKLHFQVRGATEGEHGNIKTGKDQERFFRIHPQMPIMFNDDDELIVCFIYAPDPAKHGQAGAWQKNRNQEAEKAVLSALGKEVATKAKTYLTLLKAPLPVDKEPQRTVLGRHITRYTARNTKDYFIHKDLGSFLRRELDFYLKNEVMNLDDVENADAQSVESYLKTLKIIRNIAGKLITFLAQLEDFQKKLWLKKKFVVEANYCMTLDRVPAELYPEVAANKDQWEEWKTLYGFEGKQPDENFLLGHPYVMLDTKYYDETFKAVLLENIESLDENCDGILIHSENFQALSLIQDRYRNQIKCVYIDPPYNTDASPILYKNSYKSSSWCSFIYDRIIKSYLCMQEDANICITIDEYEIDNLKKITDSIFNKENFLASVVIRNNPSGRSTVSGFAISHETGLFYAKNMNSSKIGRLNHSDEQSQRYDLIDDEGRAFEWENLRKSSTGSFRIDRPKQFFPIYYNASSESLRIPDCTWCEKSKCYDYKNDKTEQEELILPIDDFGRERVWNFGINRAISELKQMIVEKRNDKLEVYKKKYLQSLGVLPRTWWDKKEYSARDSGTRVLRSLFASHNKFDFPKAVDAVKDALIILGLEQQETCLDFFSGSGTTAHAVINLNREDNGQRKYIMVEMGEHFHTVLKPRIQKVVYSADWKDGKPLSKKAGISHCFKYMRLESYEDTLNNLTLARTREQNAALDANQELRQDVMLRYMLDLETKGSQSLLNIDQFKDPLAYKLLVKKTASNEYEAVNVDLMETFNWLIGLRVNHIAAPQYLTAEFEREHDPELPEAQQTRLVLKGKPKRATASGASAWWFRKVEGWMPADRFSPNNGDRTKTLIIWRNLTGDLEKDNAMLQAWFANNCINTHGFEFDIVYVNGSNTLPNLRQGDALWKVRLIEEAFSMAMWNNAQPVQ